jgi:hypothetical protein
MSEAKQYVSLTFEASDDFPNPFKTPHPFGAVVAFCREDAVSDLYRLRETNAELLAALRSISEVHIKELSDMTAVANRMQATALAAIAKAERKL